MRKQGQFLVLLMMVLWCAGGPTAYAQRTGTTMGAKAAYSCWVDAEFGLSYESGELNDTVKVYFTASTDLMYTNMVQATFTWAAVSSYLTYVGLDTVGYKISADTANFTLTSYGTDTLGVTVEGPWAARRLNYDTLFAVKFRINCMPPSTWKDVPIVGSCTDNRTWFRDTVANVLRGPTHLNGKVRIKPLVGEMYFSAGDTAVVHDTAELPVDYTANFDVVGGYGFHCTYDAAKLTYAGIRQTGYASQGDSLCVTLGSGTLQVRSVTTHGLSADTAVGLFALRFENIMNDDSLYSWVYGVKTKDTMFMCSQAYAINSTSVPGMWAFTPPFIATFSIKDTSVTEGATSALNIQLLNNHEVDMDVQTDSMKAAFTIGTDSLDVITIPGAGAAQNVTENNRYYKWTQITGYEGPRRLFREDDEQPSDDIWKHVALAKVAGVTFTAGYVASTKSNTAYFTYTKTSSDGAFKKDMQLKARYLNVVIRSDTALGDNHLSLDPGIITVFHSGGGGGSCPFVYTWDGSDYRLEDAILTASEKLPEGTAVTDYLPLTFTPAMENGSYRIRIHEEEAEKTFLDEAELMIIDHEPGFDASVSTDGNVIFGNGRIRPVEVIDEAGTDLTNLLVAEDNQRFEGADNGSLTATFSRREGEIYALSADDSTDWGKDPCDVRSGPLGQTKPEPTTCRIEVQDVLGTWHELPSEPMRLPKTRIRPVIDLSSYDLAPLFNIRYTWDGKFSLDEISLSVQVPVEHVLRRAVAFGISHSSDHPSAKLAAQADGRYAELVTGEYLDLEFPAEPVPAGMERTLVLVTKGYFLQWFGHEDAARPLAFGLNGNYPNPFNPSTTIRYSLAADAPVRLEIFNVLGQRVRTLVADATQPAGSYETFWDGTNDHGQFVGSGVYLYRLQAADFVETRKMIMLK